MIVRFWRGWTSPSDADAYQALLRSEIVTGIVGRSIPGFNGIDVLRRDVGDEVEFATVMRFDDWDAVRAFAGEDAEAAVVPPEAQALLRRFDARSAHYEQVDHRQPRPTLASRPTSTPSTGPSTGAAGTGRRSSAPPTG